MNSPLWTMGARLSRWRRTRRGPAFREFAPDLPVRPRRWILWRRTKSAARAGSWRSRLTEMRTPSCARSRCCRPKMSARKDSLWKRFSWPRCPEEIMNPNTSKDIRVLLPAFGLTVGATLVPQVLGLAAPGVWMVGLFLFGCVVMGAEAFGIEFHQGTLAHLLTQPIPRSWLWRSKMGVLAAAMMMATAAMVAALLVLERRQPSEDPMPWIGIAFIPLCALCAAPFWTLVFRNTLVGGLFTVIVPAMILPVNSYLHDQWIEHRS